MLDRFILAQNDSYQTALTEIKRGRKVSHWMWYIFPQVAGLGRSSTSQFFAIRDKQEAIDYLNNAVLASRLIEISEVLLGLESNNATEIFGKPDDMKLKSSMTLFALADTECDIFRRVLDKFFNGSMDRRTMHILGLTNQ